MSATPYTAEQPENGFYRGGFNIPATLSETDTPFNDSSPSAPDPSFDDAFTSKLDPPSEVLQAWVQAGRFLGFLDIPNAPFVFPPQHFTVISKGVKAIIESHPTGAWPQILIVLSRSSNAKPTVEKFLLQPSRNTVEAELVYTRVLYTLSDFGFCLLASEVTSDDGVIGIPFSFQTFDDEDMRGIFHRAKLARKLRFIESLYNVRFTLPENITPEHVRRIETLFRGITEGEFVSRGKAITVLVKAADINVSEPPFTGVGSYTQLLGSEEAVLDHPQLFDVGPVSVSLKRAVVANQIVLAPLRAGQDQVVRFEVLDNLITYRYQRYMSRDSRKRARRRLDQFYSQLEREEPAEMAATLTELLMSDVMPAEAVEIAVGWLEYHNIPDRFSPQEPVLDGERACWRVPVHLVYASGKGAPVGELLIDLKTGSIVEEPSSEVMYQEGLALAESILRVG